MKPPSKNEDEYIKTGDSPLDREFLLYVIDNLDYGNLLIYLATGLGFDIEEFLQGQDKTKQMDLLVEESEALQ